jgi:hypothetical protein
MPYAILRTTKISSFGQLAASGQHTFRERETPNADRAITNSYRGATTATELIDAVKARVDLADEKSASEPVLAIEYLITASPEAFKRHGGQMQDTSEYFLDAARWLQERHGKDNVVSLALHRDEQTPHLVAYVVPLVEREAKTRKRSVVVGKDAQGKQIRETREFAEAAKKVLSAKHFLGGREKMRAMQTDFAEKVARKYGLERGIEGSRARHQTVKEFYAAIQRPVSEATITPEQLQPRVTGKTFLYTYSEAPEAVADRITRETRELYKPAIEAAKIAASAQRRADEMSRTAKDLNKRLKAHETALKPVMDLAVLDRSKFIDLVKLAASEVEQAKQSKSRGRGQDRGPSR